MTFIAPSRTWIEVSLDNVLHNYREIQRITNINGKKPRVMCVVKANAYGHGAAVIAKRLEKEGCDMFGVAALEEALELRRAGVRADILVLNHIDKARICEAVENNITLTLFSKDMAECISGSSIKTAKVHVKIDTGLNRVGFKPNEALEAVQFICTLPNIEIEGIFTHFASAGAPDATYTKYQKNELLKVFAELESAGIDIKFKHCANSAATISYPDMHFDMVRAAIAVLGHYPSEAIDKSRINLKPSMQLKTQIIRIIDLEPGSPVGYGGTFVTSRKTKLATIPIGYGDGLSCRLAGKLKVLVNGQAAPVVGTLCMDQCMVDITDITGDVAVYDEIVIFGEQKGAFISVEQVAAQMGTVHYELLCLPSRRVPRYYIENGKVIDRVDFILD